MKIAKFGLMIMIIISIISIDMSAQPYGKGRGPGECIFQGERIAMHLDLTESQREQVSHIILKHQKEVLDYKNQLEKNMLEMKEMRVKGTVNRNAYITIVEQNNKLRNSMRISRANKEMDIFDILDADQKKKWENIPMWGGRGFDKPDRPQRGRRFQRGW